MDNFFDMNTPSKNAINNGKRIHAQAADFLKQYNESLTEALDNAEKEKNLKMMSGARFSQASSFAKSKNRKMKLTEEIEYTNKSAIIGMTEMIASVVEGALLLDENELVKIYPEYKTDMREIISGYLSNAQINESVNNLTTRELMEYVSRKLPSIREGISLTEEEIGALVKKETPLDVERKIKDLSGNVASRVTELVEKEAERIDDIEKEVDKVQKASEKDEKENDKKDDETKEEDSDMASENEFEDNDKADTDTEDTPKKERNIHAKTGSHERSPQHNLAEMFVRETPRSGLLESVAVNEAQNMLSSGKGYNGDVCLAKALMYITITETMDEMGLMNVGMKEYANIIESAGGTLNEYYYNGSYSNSGKSAANRAFNAAKLSITTITKPGSPDFFEINGKRFTDKAEAEAYMKKVKEKLTKKNAPGGGRPVDYSGVKESTELDFAERIRQRKLNK